MIKIVQDGHKALREIAKEVPVAQIQSVKIKKVIADMKEALASQGDGVAIAAPQIAETLRIFVVSGKVFDDNFIRGKDLEEKLHPDLTFINPVITKISKDKKLLPEGCLSVRPLYGKVRRSTRATVEAYDENGKKFVMSGTGLLAHIFQHETDHLDGILFIDKAKDVHESTSEEEFKKNGK
jgi:peptide deformylase